MTGYRTLFAAAVLGTGLAGPAGLGAANAATQPCKCLHHAEAVTAHDQFMALLREADERGLFALSGPITIFAPSDHALSAIAPQIEAIKTDPSGAALARFVGQHVIRGDVSTDVPPRGLSRAATLDGETRLEFHKGRSTLRVGDARIVKANIENERGFVHVIDRPLVSLT